MTQEIPYRTRSSNSAPADRATRTSAVTPPGAERRDSWFAKALSDLCRVLIDRREDEIPDSLIDDLGLRGRAISRELRSEFNRLDAQVHARFY